MRLDTPARTVNSISLTPLIDVVFLLLVFFMLASTFMKFTSVDITTSGSGQPAATSNLKQMALVHVEPKGHIVVNGHAVSRTNLVAHLKGLHAKGVAQVVLVVRKGATVADLTNALAEVHLVPFNNIRIAN